MTKQEIVNEIKKFGKLVEDKNNTNDGYYEYEIYEDDNSGALFEIDYDGDELVHAYEIDDCGEQLRVLF